MFKAKLGSTADAANNQNVSVAPYGQGIPTSAFNDEAANSPYKVHITWTNFTQNTVDADVENTGNVDLPNLYLQLMTYDTGANDEWSAPVTVGYNGQDGLPAGKGGTVTIQCPYSIIERLHVYYVDDTPAGPVQREVHVDQTSNIPK
jgi:hypothetical protein